MNASRWLMAGLGLIVVFAIAGLVIFDQVDQKDDAPRVVIDQKLLEKNYSAKLGNPEAKVKLVEFFDPACGTCASFYPFVKQLMAANPDKIELQVRYAPFHQGSDFVVMLLEAARLQDMFWEALEVLYANQDKWTQQHVAVPELVVQVLSATKLDMNQLQQDYRNERIISRIRQDIDDGMAIPVEKTPEFFVNGQPLSSFGYQQLQHLVEQEIARQY